MTEFDSARGFTTPGPRPAPGDGGSGDVSTERQPSAARSRGADTIARAPSPTLPKGGGAIRGIGETFTANPANGTGTMTVPVATSEGRGALDLDLALSYDSGAGSGPFGLGWGMALPAVTRKTDKQLPTYVDDVDADVFVLAGAEDLVPVLVADPTGGAGWQPEVIPTRVVGGSRYRVRRYRPRLESAFARVERWTNEDDRSDVFWRSISSDGITSWFGRTAESRIADPGDPSRIFSWLICETHDDRGNAVVHRYKREDSAGVAVGAVNELGRDDRSRSAQLYPKRIRYGNVSPYFPSLTADEPWPEPDGASDAWHFEVVLDYGDHDLDAPTPDESSVWPVRPDVFSSNLPGFELRTYRRCRRVLMFHSFAAEPDVGAGCLVRSTDLAYVDSGGPAGSRGPVYSLLGSVTACGYRRTASGYVRRSFPPVELDYTRPVPRPLVDVVDRPSAPGSPLGVGERGTQHGTRWTDLRGDGLPGILTEHAGAWSFEENLSPARTHDGDTARARFAVAEPVASKPSISLADGAEFRDLAGDGRPDIVLPTGPGAGFWQSDGKGSWEAFRSFARRPTRGLADPDAVLVDLDGDGREDLLIADGDAFVWHRSLGEDGFSPGIRVPLARDEARAPRVIFSDPTQSIHVADLTGDGLADIVRVRNGEVSYWPNLGHARFGTIIRMDRAPVFDHADRFDPSRLRLADIDGSGTADIIYLHREGARLYFNQCGNAWSAAEDVAACPRIDDNVDIQPFDLLGTGTTCLVWSSELPADAIAPIRYVDLMGGQKPHLLRRVTNNLGAETIIDWAPSTTFSVRDRMAGRPWRTRLPFPVHVVERVTTLDRISGSRFVTEYAYHHGCFDGVEREFRGFAMVEQWDMGRIGGFTGQDETTTGAGDVDAESHVSPVLTRTWFHPGVLLSPGQVSDPFAGLVAGEPGEYYREPGSSDEQARSRLLPDTVLPTDVPAPERSEAVRALKGMMLRQETYGLDAGPDASESERVRSATPYLVVEQNLAVRRLQPRDGHRPGAYFVHPLETLTTHYERRPADPRITHEQTLAVDDFGNVLAAVDIAYGRAGTDTVAELTPADRVRQRRTSVTFTESRFTVESGPGAASPDHHRAPLPAEERTYELTGFTPGDGARFAVSDWGVEQSFVHAADEIAYDEPEDTSIPQRRLIEHVRTRYRADDLRSLSPVGSVESLALPGETYELALTPAIVARVFSRHEDGQPDTALLPDPAPVMEGRGPDGGGYLAWDGGWWVPSGRTFLDPDADPDQPGTTAQTELAEARAHFFVPRLVVDAFGGRSRVGYDAYDLLVASTTDAVGNEVSVSNDYRVLQPGSITDANRNRRSVVFDSLGLVAATAVRGKPGSQDGDSIATVEADPPAADLRAFAADPLGSSTALLADATTRVVYDLDRFRRSAQPPFVATLARERHADGVLGAPTPIQVAFSFSDGFGRELQRKVRAEPGDAPLRSAPVALPAGDVAPGSLERDAHGVAQTGHAAVRWVGSGRIVFDRKGNAVKQYEPFFSSTHLYESEHDVTDQGVSAVLFHDPVGRVVATLHPDGTWEKVVFDAWSQTVFDASDTVVARGVQTGDPRTDADVRGLTRPYFTAIRNVWSGWHAARAGGALGLAAQQAAEASELHAGTPTTAHLDPRGRVLLHVARNRYERSGRVVDESVITRFDTDVEGNRLAVRDGALRAFDAQGSEIERPGGRIVLRCSYDLLGNALRESSMDAGDRWTLADATGSPIRSWDGRGFTRRRTYDALRRPVGVYVSDGGAERLAELTEWGEAQGDVANHRGRVHRSCDGAGVVTHSAYDFKGNLVQVQRQLVQDYAALVDWANPPALDAEQFVRRVRFDALERETEVVTPDGSVSVPTYSEANLLDRVDVRLRGAAGATPFITGIDYNARGQRIGVTYANGATTTMQHDPATFRLVRLTTSRGGGGDALASSLFVDAGIVQDLAYTYDPTGNATRIEDAALATVFHAGQAVEPARTLTYDALSRLIAATGREHIAQNAWDDAPALADRRDLPFAGNRVHPNDLLALRTYLQRFEYDVVGNLEAYVHRAGGAGWTRRYGYDERNPLDVATASNRLSHTTVANGVDRAEAYESDAHGNLVRMPHVGGAGHNLHWDENDRLRRADLGGGGTAHYAYDAAGERVRKVVESHSGTRQRERISIDGFEVYREYVGGDVDLERETLHVSDAGRPVALVESQTVADRAPVASVSSVVRYQLGDLIGSTSVELDAHGALISYEEYHPYGTTAFQAGRSAAEVSLKRYRHTGRERDGETGFTYHGARYLAPWLGRWISADPSGVDADTNLFAYVGGNPVMYHDSDGRARRKDLEENKSAKYALVIVNLSDKKAYAYESDKNGKLSLSKTFSVKPGDEKKELGSEKGDFKSKTGLFEVTEIHENYSTKKYPTKASDYGGFGALGAPFGKYAIHMGPNASGQWMHGTRAIIGDLSVALDIGDGSHGCVRMQNSDVTELAENIKRGTPILRIYTNKVKTGGSVSDVPNPYGYTDARDRTFSPDEAKITGPQGAVLAPSDAAKGGHKDAVDRLRKLGVTVVETVPPKVDKKSAAPAKRAPAKPPTKTKSGAPSPAPSKKSSGQQTAGRRGWLRRP